MSELQIKTIAAKLQCNLNTANIFLKNFRFSKYLLYYRPQTYIVNEDFITDLTDYLRRKNSKATREMLKHIDNLKTP